MQNPWMLHSNKQNPKNISNADMDNAMLRQNLRDADAYTACQIRETYIAINTEWIQGAIRKILIK